MTNKVWKDRTSPNIEHVTSLFENEILGAFMSGHLILEAILVQMLETKPKNNDNGKYFNWSFKRKVDAAESRDFITPKMAIFLGGLNNIRNRLAHHLDKPLSFDEAFQLAEMAAKGGVDFSDDTIYSDKQRSREWYGIEGIVQEVFQNASQDLLFTLDDDNYLHDFVGERSI